MKKVFFKNIFLALLVTLAVSCQDDYLNKFPIDKPASSTFLQTETELEMAVNGAYRNLWSEGLGGYNMPFESMLDCATDIGWERSVVSWQELGNGKVDPNNEVVKRIWEICYTGIQRCNYIIKNTSRIENVTDKNKVNRNVAEVRFLRAYWYHHLVEMFGDVPLVTEPLELSESMVTRTAKDKVYDFILTEMEEISTILPEKFPTAADNGRVTKGAALALKAKVALYSGKFDVASNAAKRVMDAGTYSLDANYDGLFIKSKQDVSKEIMFKIPYLWGVTVYNIPQGLNTRNGKGYSAKIPNQAMIDSYLCKDGLTIDKSPLFNPQKPYLNRDPRLNFSCVVPGSVFDGYQFETHKDSLKCWNYNTTPATRVANQDATNPYASFSGYCWRKYTNMENPEYLTRSETAYVLIRYAEVLLTYAEAKIEVNQIDQSVYDAINLVRKRVSMPTLTTGKTQAELRTIVRMERKVEFAFEGKRLYDIRRWKIAEQVLSGNLLGRIPKGILASAPAIDANGTPSYNNVSNMDQMRVVEVRMFDKNKNYLWPIPQIEVSVNPKLGQNPGY